MSVTSETSRVSSFRFEGSFHSFRPNGEGRSGSQMRLGLVGTGGRERTETQRRVE